MEPVKKIGLVLATWFGCGLSPKAPGTVGTLGAIPFYLLVSAGQPVWLQLVTAAGIVAIGTWAAGIAGEHWREIDCQKIVIDEVAGYLLTMAFVAPTINNVIAGFLLFRLFDISKIFPVGYADRNVKNAFGVMLDDLLAGCYSAAALYLLDRFLLRAYAI
jgi:phosphatidylglycerophosphatase A